MHGDTWSEIGSVLGVTRQAAQQRFLSPHREYSPDEFTEELRDAMARVKQVAVRQRNNYIGTEHLLWGVVAEPTSATRLLDDLGVSSERVHRAVQARLTIGASRAAERIAFTPYARKVLAIAHNHAAVEAASNGSQTDAGIGCNHVLIGLALLGRGIATEILTASGLDPAELHPS